jgi:hypothetical protein
MVKLLKPINEGGMSKGLRIALLIIFVLAMGAGISAVLIHLYLEQEWAHQRQLQG